MSEKHLGNTGALRWTPAQDAALKSLRSRGLSAAGCASEINFEFQTGYSRNAVIGRMKRLGMCEAIRLVRQRPKAVPKKRHQPYKPRPKPEAHKIIPQEIAVLRCAEITPRNVPLTDLASNECRFPYGDGPFTFCGHPASPDQPYCKAHADLCRGWRS